MTTQTVQIHTYDYGASLSSDTIRSIADDTLVATADSVNELTADSGLYAAVFEEASVIAAGTYRLRAVVSGQPINRYVTLAGTNNEVVQSRSERLAVLDSDAQAMVTAFNAMRSGNVFTAPALANAPTGGSGSGTGARTVTITVNDGTTVLENALVRITEGSNTFYKLTNSSGVAVLNVDDATYTVAITKAGYSYSGTSLVVNGDEAETYSMTAISISNPTAGRVARRSIPVTVVDRVT